MTTPSEEEARDEAEKRWPQEWFYTEGSTDPNFTPRRIPVEDGRRTGFVEGAMWAASRVSTPPAAEPKETPDDSEINDAIANAESWFDALWEIATKYDVPVTNNHPRWQDGQFLRPIGEFIGDIDDAAKKWMAVSTPPSEDWEYGWKYAQPLTQSEWRTVYPYKVHPSMVQVRRRIVPQSDWEVVPASPAPVSSEYAAALRLHQKHYLNSLGMIGEPCLLADNMTGQEQLWCGHCVKPWPCPTVAALGGEA